MISIELYRVRIGSFQQRAKKRGPLKSNMSPNNMISAAVFLILIQVVLILAGDVESNPGPKDEIEHSNKDFHFDVTPTTSFGNINDQNIMCMCCLRSTPEKEGVKFDKANYDFDDETVLEALSQEHYQSAEGDINYLCRSCHRKLRRKENYKAKMPKFAAANEIISSIVCMCCKKEVSRRQSILLKQSNYDFDDTVVNEALGSVGENSENYLCRSCDRNLRKREGQTPRLPRAAVNQKRLLLSEFNSGSCDNTSQSTCEHDGRSKKRRIEFSEMPASQQPNESIEDNDENQPMDTITSVNNSDENQLMANNDNNVPEINNMDTENREDNVYKCTCCHRQGNRKNMVLFREQNYNMDNVVVQNALACRLEDQDTEYMCKTCHKNLRLQDPKMPRYAVGRIKTRAADKFLKACDELPEFVCTSCHRLLFRKTVHVFSESKYDMNNEVVKKVLGAEYRYKADYQNDEYICKTCHHDLKRKNPKMPAQAAANCLTLPKIPPQLSGLNEIERRLISLRIPFLKIMAMHRAGSHYKVNGPCVNVPSTISKFCQLLPRLPDEAQLIPMKLKRKIIYKGYHMRGHIRKDVVMNAVKWLKENNEHYKDIQLNELWDEEWMATELGAVLAGEETNNEIVSLEESNIHDESNDRNSSENRSIEEVREEEELQEDQEAADRHAEICGQPYSSTLQLKNIEDAVYSIAPGEDNTPKYILLDKEFEVLAFPDLFPNGNGGYETAEKRETDLSLRRYYQQRILNVDGRFARNIEYIACAQYATELKQLKSDAGIALKMTRGRQLRGQSMNAGMLRNSAVIQDLIHHEQAYKFMKNIRGSPAYWQHQLFEVLAMIRSLGIPTWFLTLSAADLHWPQMIQAVMRQYGEVASKDDIAQMDWQTKSNKLMANPATGCRMFQYRVEAFFSEYVLSVDNPLGEIHDHVIKIEFQERGTPHAHCLLWARDAPRIDIDSDEVVCEYVDKYISGGIPSDDNELKELILKLETHSHSAYCRRNSSCRFGFPKAPSPKTVIARMPEDELTREDIIKNSREVLGKIHDVLNDNKSLSMDEVLQKANVSMEQYIESLKVSKQGKNIILKRSPADILTNGCNHEILRIWRANIDFQYVIDAYSTVMYVISYMMKSEKAMGEILKRIGKECRHEDIATQLKKIGAAFLGNRVVGMPESVMRLNSMWLIKKSRKVIYVNGSMKEDRVSLPKIGKDLELMADDDEDIFMTSIHDRYAARPDSLNDMCLACFAVNYDTTGSNEELPQVNEGAGILLQDRNNDNISNRRNETINLKNNLGVMRKRRREAIFRSHRFDVMKDSEKYYHAQLLLYYPWQSENELKGECATYEEHYNTVKQIIQENARHFEHNTEHLDNAFNELAENGPPESVWDAVAPGIEEENVAARQEGYYAIRNLENEDLDDHNEMILAQDGITTESNKGAALSMLFTREAQKDIMTPSEYRKCLRGLNPGQREIIMYNRQWCKKTIQKLMKGESAEPFRIFLSGPGGTGKSHVISLIRRDVIYFFRMIKEDPYPNTEIQDDKPLVLLTAPTGAAAFQISGLTLHSALQLCGNGRSLSYEKKAILSNRLSQLKLLVTDEISMVGSPQLEDINKQLCMIHGTSSTYDYNFGGVSILAVGDLYQLPPVKSCPIYKRPKVIREPGDLAPLPWHSFQFHELTQSMRQKDTEFAKVLNVIRVRVPEKDSYEDKVLKSRELDVDEDDPLYPSHAMHVYARNTYAMKRNIKMLDTLPGDIYLCMAEDKEKDTHTNIAEVKFSDNPNKTGNLLDVLKIKVGARVMLTTNVDVTDGLTNGAMGTVTTLVLKNFSNAIDTILVKFDGANVGKNAIAHSKYKHLDKSAVPIKKVQATFAINGKTNSCQGSRIQFPLFLSWAVSIHKCQGLTLEEIVVDMSRDKGAYQKGQAYVAVSRVKTLEKLHIINYTLTQIKVSADVANEMERLRQNKLPHIQEPFIRRIDHNSYFSIAHLNVHNLNAKKEDVACDQDIQKADVICLSETHLSRNDIFTAQNIGMKNSMETYRCDRNSNGGGISICVDSKYNPRLIETQNSGIEVIGIQVHVPHAINIFCAYRPPLYDKKQFTEKLCSVVNDHCDVPVCILGDFNENLLGNMDKHIWKTFTNAGFTQHVEHPTRDSGTLLDHVYTYNIRDATVDVYDCYYSDHDIVFCCLKIC